MKMLHTMNKPIPNPLTTMITAEKMEDGSVQQKKEKTDVQKGPKIKFIGGQHLSSTGELVTADPSQKKQAYPPGIEPPAVVKGREEGWLYCMQRTLHMCLCMYVHLLLCVLYAYCTCMYMCCCVYCVHAVHVRMYVHLLVCVLCACCTCMYICCCVYCVHAVHVRMYVHLLVCVLCACCTCMYICCCVYCAHAVHVCTFAVVCSVCML